MGRLFASASSHRGENAAAALATKPLSMAAWFKPTTSTATQVVLSLSGAGAANKYWVIGLVTANTTFAEEQGTGIGSAAGPAGTIADGAWGHIGGTFATGATGARISYCNGLAGTTNTSNLVVPVPDRTDVGCFFSTPTGTRVGFANGIIAEAGIWNVVLTAGEMFALSRGVSPRMIRPVALVFYAPLWGTGSPEPDYTAGQKHLTLTGPPTTAEHPRVAPLTFGDQDFLSTVLPADMPSLVMAPRIAA